MSSGLRIRNCAENGFGARTMLANRASFTPSGFLLSSCLDSKTAVMVVAAFTVIFFALGDILVVLFELVTLFFCDRYGQFCTVCCCLRVGNTCDGNELQGSR